MTNWEAKFSTPEKLVETMEEQYGQCLMGCLGYECTGDQAVQYRCPLYHRSEGCYKAMLEWLQEEAS